MKKSHQDKEYLGPRENNTDEVVHMATYGIPENLLLGGSLFLVGFIIFVVFYIIARLIAERKGHTHYERKEEEKKDEK